jgi:hypothetical protein
MNRLAAALFSSLAFAALAQPTNVPEQKCEPKPTYPGLKALKSDVEVKAFEGQIKSYKECVMGYISDRKSAIKANEQAASAAADEHNRVMDKIRADQEAQRAASEKK